MESAEKISAAVRELVETRCAAGRRRDDVDWLGTVEPSDQVTVAAIAGSPAVMTATSPEQKIIDDNCCTHPTTGYGAAKLFSENLGMTYKRLHGLDFRWLRLPALIRPNARARGYAEWFNKAIEESVHGRPYSIFVAPRTQMVTLMSRTRRGRSSLWHSPR